MRSLRRPQLLVLAWERMQQLLQRNLKSHQIFLPCRTKAESRLKLGDMVIKRHRQGNRICSRSRPFPISWSRKERSGRREKLQYSKCLRWRPNQEKIFLSLVPNTKLGSTEYLLTKDLLGGGRMWNESFPEAGGGQNREKSQVN